MKKILSAMLAILLAAGSLVTFSVSAEETQLTGVPTGFTVKQALYAHAVSDSEDGEAWTAWQGTHSSNSLSTSSSGTRYFFLPSSTSSSTVDIYNGYSSSVTFNGVSIPSGQTKSVSYTTSKSYTVSVGGTSYTARFYKSNAEASIYVNNSDANGTGSDLMSYLSVDKSRYSTATGAIVDADGTIDNTPIKKIKGRGNTTWNNSAKKPFNITYTSKVSVAGMSKGKKYSLLANYQDDSLSRNRFLYDLADAVGTPYASDSRYVDFYCNGFYMGSYQMTEKVETGSSSLVYDVEETDYLNEDGTVKEDFSFLCEVDSGAGADDYYVKTNSGNNITIKSPELEVTDPGYNEVKQYVKKKFDAFFTAATNKNADLSPYADIDSITKLYLINELGKNWDSGVSSMFLVYKPDKNGKYKFFGSPVWDYDNSLGNATGVASDLNSMGVNDYTAYTGWWCRYKGRTSGASSSSNIMNNIANNTKIINASAEIWFEEFVPAINHFAGVKSNSAAAKEIYTASEYYKLLSESANMNYQSGWSINTSSWIANHGSLNKATYSYSTNKLSYTSKTYSTGSIYGVFNFAADWMTSRAAWISSQLAPSYKLTSVTGDVTRDSRLTVHDVTELQRLSIGLGTFSLKQSELGDINGDGKISVADASALQELVLKADPEQVATVPDYTVAPTTKPADNKALLFTIPSGWSTPLYMYYWSDSNTAMTSWPGVKMEFYANTSYGGSNYVAYIPTNATYVIFSDSKGNQTADLPYNTSITGYYLSGSTAKSW